MKKNLIAILYFVRYWKFSIEKRFLILASLLFCIFNAYSYIEIGYNYQFFKKHGNFQNVKTNNIYFCIGKYYKKDSSYRYFFGLGALPQHIKIYGYDYYDIHNIWQIGLARRFSITPKNKIDVFLKLRSSFLGGWKIGYAFPAYTNKSSDYLNKVQYTEFFHSKGIELGTEVNVLPRKLKSKLLLSGSVEYKFYWPEQYAAPYFKVEGNVFYYSLGIAYRQYFNK